jgi:hypothetical protein
MQESDHRLICSGYNPSIYRVNHKLIVYKLRQSSSLSTPIHQDLLLPFVSLLLPPSFPCFLTLFNGWCTRSTVCASSTPCTRRWATNAISPHHSPPITEDCTLRLRSRWQRRKFCSACPLPLRPANRSASRRCRPCRTWIRISC